MPCLVPQEVFKMFAGTSYVRNIWELLSCDHPRLRVGLFELRAIHNIPQRQFIIHASAIRSTEEDDRLMRSESRKYVIPTHGV